MERQKRFSREEQRDLLDAKLCAIFEVMDIAKKEKKTPNRAKDTPITIACSSYKVVEAR